MSTAVQQVVLASHNTKKLEELKRIVGPALPGIELIGYDGPEPAETGVTFEENALLKARAAAAHTGLPAIADDSGIAVEVLGGSPGIFSARWGGPARSDTANVDLLLWQLSDIDDPHRGAEFVCAAALVVPSALVGETGETGEIGEGAGDANEIVRVGRWPGTVLKAASGGGGFGYDPVFCPEGETRSSAQMTSAEKDAASHRTRAFTALAPEILARVLGAR